MRCSSRACSFFASSYSAFSAMSPNSGHADPVRDLAALLIREILDLFLEVFVAFRSEDYVLHRAS
jgi:hypothetical protein